MKGAGVLFVLLAACSSHNLDRSVDYGGESASGVPIESVPVHGAEVEVYVRKGSNGRRLILQGELLAVDAFYLYLLEDERTVAIANPRIIEMSVEQYDGAATETGIWTAAGTVSTLSHGIFLIFTAPAWLGTGIGSSVGAANADEIDVEDGRLLNLYQHARFPQGLPPGWSVDKVMTWPPADGP